MTHVWVPTKGVLRRMGLTMEEYLQLWQACRGRCPICEKPMGRVRFPCVDHRHNDGLIRGLICAYCNDFLGTMHDNAGFLLRAGAYLQDPPAVAVFGERYVPHSPGAAQ